MAAYPSKDHQKLSHLADKSDDSISVCLTVVIISYQSLEACFVKRVYYLKSGVFLKLKSVKRDVFETLVSDLGIYFTACRCVFIVGSWWSYVIIILFKWHRMPPTLSQVRLTFSRLDREPRSIYTGPPTLKVEYITAVVLGTNAQEGSFPWMAMLKHEEYDRQFCGGSLIHDGQWVLTARHCIDSLPSSVML